jgi:hypothetical protein
VSRFTSTINLLEARQLLVERSLAFSACQNKQVVVYANAFCTKKPIIFLKFSDFEKKKKKRQGKETFPAARFFD